jgi:hypothetical protein
MVGFYVSYHSAKFETQIQAVRREIKKINFNWEYIAPT